MTADPLLTAENISLHLSGRCILHGVSLMVRAGEIVSLVGPNGAGKTTLLRVLLGLIKPESGHILRKPDLRIGYVPQRLEVDPLLPMTVAQFLSLWEGATPAQITTCLARTGADVLAARQLSKLSGGEFQRVLLARALLNNPQLLVLDEPAQAMDIAGQAALYNLLGEERERSGCAVLMVSHDLHIVMRKTDHVVCLNHHVCCAGHPSEVGRDPAYAALFGDEAQAFALYAHHHDHVHQAGEDHEH